MTVLRTTGRFIVYPRHRRGPIQRFDLGVPVEYTMPFVPGDCADVTVCDADTHRPLFSAPLVLSIMITDYYPVPHKCFMIRTATIQARGIDGWDLTRYYEFEIRKLNPKREPHQIRDPALSGL